MATKPLKTIKFPTLPDTYTVPQVDDTLSVSGGAADAKVTGDEISGLKEDLTELIDAIETGEKEVSANPLTPAWVQGNAIVDDSAKTVTTNTDNKVCYEYLPISYGNTYYLNVANGFKIYAYALNTNDSTFTAVGLVTSSGWTEGETTVTYTPPIQSYRYLLIKIIKSDNTALTPQEAENGLSVYENTVSTIEYLYEDILDKQSVKAVQNKAIAKWDIEINTFKPYAERGQILYEGDTKVNSGHIVNAVSYDDGVIIACRSDGKVVRIGYDGSEETLLSLTGTNMDWRLCYKDKADNVYVSPHASYGSMTMGERGLYRMSPDWSGDWEKLTLASWQTGSLSVSNNIVSVNSSVTAFRSTYADVLEGENVRVTWYATSSTTNTYGFFTDDNNTRISSVLKPTDGVAGYRTSETLAVPSGATRLWFMTYYQEDFETACKVEGITAAFTKVISLYDTTSSVATEADSNDDTIWTMCEDDEGNLYAGVYAHTIRANPAIYKSTDGGNTWTYLVNFNTAGLTSGGRHVHAVIYSPWQKALYCIIGEINTVFKSIDGGSTWVDLNVTLNAKGSAMCATPFGILIGSDSAYNCEIDVLFNDDKTHKTVFSGWANTIFAIRRSDLTGFIYAFTKVDSSVNTESTYPPIEAIADSSALTTWKNTSGHNVASWTAYYNSVIDTYPEDAIRPQHCAILVSRDGGARWEVLKKWQLTVNSNTGGNFIDGFWTTGFFKNGECLTGRMESNAFVNPIVISEGKHKYVADGCDLDGEIFVRTNVVSVVEQI